MKINKRLTVVIGLIIIAGVIIFAYTKFVSQNAGTPLNPGHPTDADIQRTASSAVNKKPAEVEVRHIRIPKNIFDGGIKDLALSVGDVYGNFKISNIRDVSDGPDVIQFSGEETLVGVLQLDTEFPALTFKADVIESEKLPQIYKSIYNRIVTINSLFINTPSVVNPKDFVRNEGNYRPRRAEVRITNLKLMVPPSIAFGSADITTVKYLDK